MKNVLISIALCTYNGERYLIEQLNSLINQTYKNLEFIIVDDRSSDGTWTILESYAIRDSRISIIKNDKNLGYVKNFEKAIYLCQGEYIALCDQDDIWDLNKIERMANEVKDSLLIYHDSQLIDVSGAPLKRLSDIFNMYHGSSPLPFLFSNCISGHSCMFKKSLAEIIKSHGGFNPHFYHDWWLAFVAGNYGTVSYLNETLVQYRQHSDSSTDILKVKEKKAEKSIKHPDNVIQQLQQCSTIPGKYNDLIKNVILLYQQSNWFSSFQLMLLLFKHKDELFYLRKKSSLSKINYVRKVAFHKRASAR